MAIKLNRISPSLYLDGFKSRNALIKKQFCRNINSKSHQLDSYFCILFSMTGRTALIQSSWLHVPEKVTKLFKNTNNLLKTNNSTSIPPTQIYGSFAKSVQLIKSAVNRNVAHKMKSVLFFSRRLCIKLKHLLSLEKKKMQCYITLIIYCKR